MNTKSANTKITNTETNKTNLDNEVVESHTGDAVRSDKPARVSRFDDPNTFMPRVIKRANLAETSGEKSDEGEAD